MAFLPLIEVSSDLQSYPRSVRTHLQQEVNRDHEAPMLGTVARSGKITAVAKGCNLDVINLITNERLAAWSFSSEDSADPEAEITCLCLLSVSHVIVGLDTGLHGALAVFDITEGRVVKSVALPQRVASLALIAASGGPSVPSYLHTALMYFHGMVAVGLLEGKVLLIDLNMDEMEDLKDSGPAGLYFISSTTRDVARCRRKALEAGTHLALELGDWSRGDMFVWGEEMFAGESVQVSCLYHCPQLASLCIGYNLGCWSLFSLTDLSPTYSSSLPASPAPVVGLTWQEPLDDPRDYSYLWVCRGPRVSLYSLVCRERTVEGYRDLETVTLRWEHFLSAEHHTETTTTRLISVETLETNVSTGGVQDRSGDSESEKEAGMDLSLVCLVWESEDEGERICYLGLWDINCWYQAQMPSSLEEEGVCPYLSLCEVGPDVRVSCLHVSGDSITRFGGAVEQHFYPSSLKFKCTIISAEGHIQVTHLGLQRKVLAELGKSQSLVQPSELYQYCLMSGLVNGPQLEPSLLQQRRHLLDVALEQSLVNIIIAAVREWSDGRYSKVGCNLKFLLDWAWARVVSIKNTIDTNTLGLFDHTMLDTDEGARGALVSLSGQLAQLVTVLSSLSTAGGVITELGLDTLDCKLNVTGLVLLYSQAISWFLNVGLLPEQPEGPNSPYPVSVLERQYRDKRRRLAGCTGPAGRPGLLVDILCEDIGEDLIKSFQKGGGTGTYPPPSLHSLITIFLSESPAPAKLRLVQYFFLDLAHLLSHQQKVPDLVDSLIKFPSAFSLPPSVIKLTQAFWLLDHEDWEESVSMMLDPLLQEDDLTPEHHRAVLVSLLSQDQAALALKYSRIRRPPVLTAQDISLHISVLLANGAIQEAFTFQRSRRSSNLLPLFYKKAEELSKLDSVLQLSLTSQEEREFVSFLQSSSRADSQEVLLMYYLQRSRFTEALQLNTSLQARGLSTGARDAIMSRYRDILPGLANSLANKRINLAPNTAQVRPVPLSVTLQDKNIKLSSHATQIEAMLATPKSQRNVPMTPFRARDKRKSNIVKPLDITSTTKRKADEEEGKENDSVCFPIEEDISLNKTKPVNVTSIVSPPRKRTRLSDVTTLNMSVKSMRRVSRYMTADAISILSTPTIKKVRTNVSSARIDLDSTPTSILKVKQLMNEVVESDKVLDVSLSLDKTPTMMSRSRDSTPTKALRFKEPRRLPSSLALEENKTDPNVSQASEGTNESFFSLMDVESPMASREEVDRPVTAGISPTTKAQLEKVLSEAENRLKEKEEVVMSASKPSSSSSRLSGVSSLLGNKDIFVSNEDESVDSDVSMRGKVFHRWVGETKEDDIGEEDYEEDEDDKYYENKNFEKKDCDIIVESSEDSNNEPKHAEEEVIIDSSEDEGTSNFKNMNFSWAAPSRIVDDEDIAKLINEEETIETASTSVNFNEDEELYVEEIDQDNSIEINIGTPTESHPIEIEDSPVEEKQSAKLIFSEESLAEEEEEDVIEIESDEDKSETKEPDVPTGKILFSSLYSSNEEEENPDQPDKIADIEIDDYVPEIVPGGLHPYVLDPGVVETGVVEEDKAGEEEPDVMRDLLDNVSTTATRASSIAGSLFDLESRAGSVTGEAAKPLNYSFSEPANTETEDENKVHPQPVSFVFSQPLDASQQSEVEEGPGDEEDDGKITVNTGKENDEAEASENTECKDDQSKETEIEDTENNSSDDSSDDGQEVEGLNFSWAVIPDKNISISQIINEEISFAAPNVEASEGSVDDGDNSQFEFHLPNDESMMVEDQNSEPIEDFESQEAAVSKLVFTSEKDSKDESEKNESDESIKDESMSEMSLVVEDDPPVLSRTSTLPLEEEEEKEEEQQEMEEVMEEGDKKVEVSEDTNTHEEATKLIEDQKEVTENIETPEVAEEDERTKVEEAIQPENPQTPTTVEQPETPVRRSTRKSSNSSLKTDSTPLTPTRRSARKAKTPSKRERSPVELDITTQLEAIEEENSRSSADFKAQMDQETTTRPLRSSNRKQVEETGKEEKQRLSTSQTPATPVRRSRRLSGATPVTTPVLPSRGRRVSGAQGRATNTPIITETEEHQEKFDTLELRSRDVVETLSLTSDFGQNSPGGKTRGRGRGKGVTAEATTAEESELEISAKKEGAQSSLDANAVTPKRASKSSLGDPSPVTPRRSSRSSRKVDLSLEEVELKTPTTPDKISAIPKHLTPLKDDAKTPTRRTRRSSATEGSSEQVRTPVRKSRRLSGASTEFITAPDGGLISGVTPRRTPRSRRHNTSVRAEDVETALAGSNTPLPTLVEDVESEAPEAVSESLAPRRGRGRGSKSSAAGSVTSLDVISEEGVTDLPSQPAKPSSSKRKQEPGEEVEVTGPPAKRRSRRATLSNPGTVLDTDVDLLGSPLAVTDVGERRKSTSSVAATKKKYLPVKKKTSVRIK